MRTTRLYDILRNEYKKQLVIENPSLTTSYLLAGLNDTFFEEIFSYTGNAKELVQSYLFSGTNFSLSQDEIDSFQRDFINRFLNRSIKQQTFELFKMHLISEVMVRKQVIEVLYGTTTRGKYLNEQTQTISNGNSNTNNQSTSEGTTTSTSLPQTMVDFNSVDYADNLDKNQDTQQTNSESTNSNTSTNVKMTFANLQSYQDMKTQLFAELDKALFSQVF